MGIKGGARNMKRVLLKIMKKVSNRTSKASGEACWISIMYQPKCPDSLIQKD